jgi:competence protein ComEC
MFDLRKIPMLRVLVPYFGGVLTGFRVSSATLIFEALIILILFWILVLIIFIWQRRARKPGLIPWLISPLLFMLFFIVGAGTGIHSRPLDPGLPSDQVVLVRGEVSGSPHSGNYAHSFEMKINLISSADTSHQVSTLLKCYLSMPTDSILPAQGEIWQFSGTLLPIRNSGNPGSPDYRSIMGRKNCWYRFYASSAEVPARFNKKLRVAERRLTPALIRSFVSDHWHGPLEEVSLLKAVCLGDRSSLTDDMRQAYAAAGGMHLLAVSGLHVGLIWWVLLYMTGWMSLIYRKGMQRTVLVVGLLWFYAFVTGFSSSVSRSVTMFSFFSVGRMMGERVHPLNVILASAFLLVLIEPTRLMDVGFQLSYAAIVGIITLHPLALRAVRIKNRVLRRVWEATSVSLAAQLSTAPLVIYYFHQLPIYALVSSLIAVPLLSLLIAVFVCSLPFILAGVMEQFSSFLLVELARLMNRSMELLSSLPGSVVDALQLNRWSLLVWLLLLLLGIIALYGRRRIPYFMVLLISVLLLGNSLSGLKRRSSSELIVSHFKGASMVIVRTGAQVDHYCWYRDSTSRDYMKTYIAQNWSRRIYENQVYEMGDRELGAGRISACIRVAKGVWMLGGGGSDGLVLTEDVNKQVWDRVYADSTRHEAGCPDFILLSGEPVIEGLEGNSWMTKVDLLMDGSNRSWYKERMKVEWEGIYLTDRSGAYVKRW